MLHKEKVMEDFKRLSDIVGVGVRLRKPLVNIWQEMYLRVIRQEQKLIKRFLYLKVIDFDYSL